MSGNISDFFPQGDEFVTLRTFWARQLASREIAVFWDKSAGFQFADEILGLAPQDGQLPMRDKFKATVGLNTQPQNGAANFLAGLAGNRGVQGGSGVQSIRPFHQRI